VIARTGFSGDLNKNIKVKFNFSFIKMVILFSFVRVKKECYPTCLRQYIDLPRRFDFFSKSSENKYG
jgi:hypothetical protein